MPAPTGLEGKYLCPMHPEVVNDKEGKCPICEMKLEQVPEAKKGQVKKPDAHEGHGPDHARAPKEKVLAIRASAVLDTGRRKVTYRLAKGGAFELVQLELGPRADGKDDRGNLSSYYPILSGLKEGDRVVVRGGFLLDSQRQIEGMPSLLFPKGLSGGAAPKATPEHKH
jgi:Cu(I)/Ag(I) efflux system membrane fusion protein